MSANKNIIQKFIAIILVSMILLSNSAILGANVIAYVDSVVTTSNNVELVAYFEDENGERISSIDGKIDQQDIKLKIGVTVKNEGYFNGQISMENANFKFKEVTDSKYVNKIEDNNIVLNQISADTTVVLEIKIESISDEKISPDFLNRESKINLTGTYVNSKNEVQISGSTTVRVNWKSSDDIAVKVSGKMLTNYIYKIEEENKRLIQFLIGDQIENNSYPVKNTEIEITVPEGVEKVEVHKRTTRSN